MSITHDYTIFHPIDIAPFFFLFPFGVYLHCVIFMNEKAVDKR